MVCTAINTANNFYIHQSVGAILEYMDLCKAFVIHGSLAFGILGFVNRVRAQEQS